MRKLIDSVQHNCDVADARHGSDFGMCTYLMKMRELFRWTQGLPFGAALNRAAVGEWLTTREAHLESLEHNDFVEIDLAGEVFDPFDAEGINAAIADHGLVYSAGMVNGAKPHFFLGELENEHASDNGFRLRVSGRELARCLNAPPAMTRGATIYLRRESLRRYLWEKYESWLWSRPENAMARAVACYPFESALEEALDQMTENEMAAIESHERGEYQAGLDFGENWEGMLMEVSMTPAELVARAVRDHLADCTHTLPMLVEHGRDASLHFFFANLGAMRKQLFPALQTAYSQWLAGADRSVFVDLARVGAAHWRSVGMKMLALHERHGAGAVAAVTSAGEEATL